MKKTTLSCMVLLVACLLVVEVRPALAADYYVDGPGGDGLAEGGSDTNPGTKDARSAKILSRSERGRSVRPTACDTTGDYAASR